MYFSPEQEYLKHVMKQVWENNKIQCKVLPKDKSTSCFKVISVLQTIVRQFHKIKCSDINILLPENIKDNSYPQQFLQLACCSLFLFQSLEPLFLSNFSSNNF